jgi:hypothetical protein
LDSDALGVDGGKISVFEQGDQVCLGGLLKSHYGGRLEAEVSLEVDGLERNGKRAACVTNLEVLSDLTDEALEG